MIKPRYYQTYNNSLPIDINLYHIKMKVNCAIQSNIVYSIILQGI